VVECRWCHGGGVVCFGCKIVVFFGVLVCGGGVFLVCLGVFGGV
jgi:hypothetical protein